MATYSLIRLSTFRNWPRNNNSISPLILASAGFSYSGQGDKVKCQVCLIEIEGWLSGTLGHPIDEHRKRSPTCMLSIICTQRQSDVVDAVSSPIGLVREQSETIHSLHNEPTLTLTSLKITRSADVKGAAVTDSKTATSCSDAVKPVNRYFVDSSAAELSYVDSARAGEIISTPIQFDRSKPNHALLKEERIRLQTFYDWPESTVVKPPELAADGWYYFGLNDRVKCAFCNGVLSQWVKGDKPATEHRKHFPNCPFVNGRDVGNKPLMDKRTTGAAGGNEAAGHASHGLPRSADVSHLQSNLDYDDTDQKSGNIDDEIQQLTKENRQLTDALTCKICMNKPFNTVFLPCGHFVSCDVCAPRLKNCAICRKYIRGTVKVQFDSHTLRALDNRV